MRKILTVFVVFSVCFSSARCQIFKGTVYDRLTDSTLSSAVIYISGTSIGTYSDAHGNFELDVSRYSSKPVTISLIGYYSVTLSEHSSNKMYKVYLTTKINELNEVVVNAKKGNWDSNLKIFKNEFLGESRNAMDCEILNEKDLRFSNINDSLLTAFSLKPLIILNKALGYTITYYLDKFTYTSEIEGTRIYDDACFILGNYLFKDNLPTLNESEKRKVIEKRRQAYLGSRMHFFRMLYSGKLNHRGKYVISLTDGISSFPIFIIRTDINSKSFGIKKDSLSAYLKFEKEFSVTYRGIGSKIIVKNDSVYFEKYGFYDPYGVDFLGNMSDRRMGDLLPYEYTLN
jgi:hypothetical protein